MQDRCEDPLYNQQGFSGISNKETSERQIYRNLSRLIIYLCILEANNLRFFVDYKSLCFRSNNYTCERNTSPDLDYLL